MFSILTSRMHISSRSWHVGAFALVTAIAAFLRLYDLGHGHPALAIYTSISSHAYKSFHNWLYPNMFADGSILADKPPLFFWYQGLFIALLGPFQRGIQASCRARRNMLGDYCCTS